MDTDELRHFAGTFAPDAQVQSLLYYPHPLNSGGLVLVAASRGDDWLRLLGAAHRRKPPRLSLHCLRPSELGLLGQPGIFAPPIAVNEFPHLLFWLKHRGLCLRGEDIRPQLQPRAATPHLLAAHIDACTDTLRRYGILPRLIAGQYQRVVAMLELEVRMLMATALLLHRQWDVDLKTLTVPFFDSFAEPGLVDAWHQLQALNAPAASESITERDAARAVWLFDQFLVHLEEVALCS